MQCSSQGILARLEKCRVSTAPGPKSRAWKSFRQALLSVWTKKELTEFEEKLLKYRGAIDSRILACIKLATHGNNGLFKKRSNQLSNYFRNRIDLVSFKQSKRFDELDKQTKQIATSLLDFRESFTKDFDQRMLVLTQLINRREIVVFGDDDPTRTPTITALATQSPNTIITKVSMDNLRHEKAEIVTQVTRNITESLSFPLIHDRMDNIPDAYEKTFQWVYNTRNTEKESTPWSNFTRWLESDDQLYWIYGRAASGKSTLMKYIYENPRTQEHLQKWANGSALFCTSYFFWNSGEMLQRDQSGLLRSLLYDISAQYPDLVPILFPSDWAEEYSTISRSFANKVSFNTNFSNAYLYLTI